MKRFSMSCNLSVVVPVKMKEELIELAEQLSIDRLDRVTVSQCVKESVAYFLEYQERRREEQQS